MAERARRRWVLWAVILGHAVGPGACGDGEPGPTSSPFVPTTLGSEGQTMGSGPPTSSAEASTADGTGPSTPATTGATDGVDGTITAAEEEGTTADSGFDGEPGEFTETFDGRDYRMYVPSGYGHGTAIPLLVGFHGAGDDGSNFYAFAGIAGLTDAAEPASYILVIPDTKSPFSDWANWSGNPNNDVDAMIAELDQILDLVDDVGTHYNVDAQQLHAFGFSNGGLFTALAGMARADRLATLAVLGYGWGGFYLPPGPPSRTIPVQFGCGSSDSFYGGAQSSETYLSGQGHDTRLVTAAGVGHSFTGVMGALTPTDMFAWMQARPLP